MNYDQNDIYALSLCTWKEARGEGELGMKAVMDVIVNRANKWYLKQEHPVHFAVYAKNQFTSMSVPSDPEFNLEPKLGDSQYNFCLSIAEPVLTGQISDVTNGALYYANLATATSGWFFDHIVSDKINHPQVAVIGKQTFFK